jgi:hypothetical protein
MKNIKYDISFNFDYRRRLNNAIDCVEYKTYNCVNDVIFSVVWLRTLPVYREVVENVKKQIE